MPISPCIFHAGHYGSSWLIELMGKITNARALIDFDQSLYMSANYWSHKMHIKQPNHVKFWNLNRGHDLRPINVLKKILPVEIDSVLLRRNFMRHWPTKIGYNDEISRHWQNYQSHTILPDWNLQVQLAASQKCFEMINIEGNNSIRFEAMNMEWKKF